MAGGDQGTGVDSWALTKSGQCPRVEVNANIVQCWGLTLHDRPAAQVGLNIGVVWRHQGDDGLTQSGGRLRSKITAHGC